MRSTRFGLTALLGAALIGVGAAASAQTTPYTVLDLGVLPGATTSQATDINRQVRVVGISDERPFVWDAGTGMVELPAPGPVSHVLINDAGLIVGACQAAGQPRICVWQDGALQVLTPPSAGSVTLHELTDNGILLVETFRFPQDSHFWALVTGAAYDVGALFGGRILDVNVHGLVGGISGDGRGFVDNLAHQRRYPFPPGVGVYAVGDNGHLAGGPASGTDLYLAQPDGTVDALPCGCVYSSFGNITSDGDFVANVSGNGVFYPVLVRSRQLSAIPSLVPPGLLQPWFLHAYALAPSGHVAGSAEFVGQAWRHAVLFVPNLPPAPTGVVAAPGARTVGLRWDAVAGATDYRVEAGSSPGGGDVYDGAVGNVTGVASGIGPGTYYVRVRAITPAGLGPASAEVVFTIQ